MIVPDLDHLALALVAGDPRGLIVVSRVDVARADQHSLFQIIQMIPRHYLPPAELATIGPKFNYLGSEAPNIGVFPHRGFAIEG